MYACVCKGISCERIKSCVEQGSASSFREVRNELGIGTQCGKCAQFCRGLVDEALAERAAAQAVPLWYSCVNSSVSQTSAL